MLDQIKSDLLVELTGNTSFLLVHIVIFVTNYKSFPILFNMF